VKITAHVHLVPRLMMNGAVPELPLYVFLSWTGTNLKLTFSEFSIVNVLLKSMEQWNLFIFVPQLLFCKNIIYSKRNWNRIGCGRNI
jgi:hypothetical protein